MPRLRRPAVLVPLIAALAVVGGVVVAVPALGGSGEVTMSGLTRTAYNAQSLRDAAVSMKPGGKPSRILVDGRRVAQGSSGTLTYSLAQLGQGKHVVTVETDRGFPRGTAKASRTVTVDTTPPALKVTAPTTPVGIKDKVTVKGTVDAGSTVKAAGGTVAMAGSAFTVTFPTPPAGAEVVATDPAGNATSVPVTVPTAYPHNIRGVHMTGAAWAYSKLREPVLQMIREHRINAVQLDIKDEDGVVTYASQVPLAKQAGATANYFDPKKVTAQLHGMGVRVIGRIVAFNDPKLTAWAEKNGKKDWFIQQPDGSKYLYGYNKHGFSNFANPAVRKYQEDIAVEAVKNGFDDIVYDYVRRPDGKISGMRFPGLVGDPEDAIAGFLRETQAKIRPLGGSLGAAAFAQAATRPKSTAQNIPKMAKYLDVVIPMDYPSHWNPGEYGVADTYVGAYDIVKRSLVDWQKDVKGTNCVVVPWLQDENYKGRYTAAKVQEEINGARSVGIPGWLMWSAVAKYTPAAYTPDATPAR